MQFTLPDDFDILIHLENIDHYGTRYAESKAELTQLEHFIKSKKAILMSQSEEKTVAMKEVWALAHPEYIELIDGIATATEQTELYRHKVKKAELSIEVWRSTQATNRSLDRRM